MERQALSSARITVVRRPDRRDFHQRHHLSATVRRQFTDLPALELSIPQAVRLFGIKRDACVRILAELVDEGFLRRTNAGYARGDRHF
jgi:Fic family protein